MSLINEMLRNLQERKHSDSDLLTSVSVVGATLSVQELVDEKPENYLDLWRILPWVLIVVGLIYYFYYQNFNTYYLDSFLDKFEISDNEIEVKNDKVEPIFSKEKTINKTDKSLLIAPYDSEINHTRFDNSDDIISTLELDRLDSLEDEIDSIQKNKSNQFELIPAQVSVEKNNLMYRLIMTFSQPINMYLSNNGIYFGSIKTKKNLLSNLPNLQKFGYWELEKKQKQFELSWNNTLMNFEIDSVQMTDQKIIQWTFKRILPDDYNVKPSSNKIISLEDKSNFKDFDNVSSKNTTQKKNLDSQLNQVLTQRSNRQDQLTINEKYQVISTLIQDNHLQEAINLLEIELEKFPNEEKLWQLLAATAHKNSDFQLSEKGYRQLLNFNSKLSTYWLGLALSLDQQQQTIEALKAFRNANDLDGLTVSLQDYVSQRIEDLSIKLTNANVLKSP